jgi:uncharacterized protein YdhG (YjbR/CyaY superfamily)
MSTNSKPSNYSVIQKPNKIIYKDVDMYIEKAPEAAKPILNEFREIIKTTAPKAEEKISYNVPYYKYLGELVGFSAFSKHATFGFNSNALDPNDRLELEKQGYKLGSNTIQIKFEQKVPVNAIKKIILTQLKLNESGGLFKTIR